MSATRMRRARAIGTALLVALAAAAVAAGTAGGSSAAPSSAVTTAGVTSSPVPVEQLPGASSSTRGAQATPGAVSRTVRVAPSSVGLRDSRLEILVGRKHVPFRNGGRLELADGLAAELFLDPFPPTTRKLWLDVRLTRGSRGTPVAGAKATMAYDMELMPHGTNRANARNVGGGHYLYAVEDSMYGAWLHTLRIVVGKRTHEVRLIVVTAPA